jgi:hypothetical protein
MWEHRLPELKSLPLAQDRGTGYDGQFGAQLAVHPDPEGVEIQDALDNPMYRSRRILLPWTAHVLGEATSGPRSRSSRSRTWCSGSLSRAYLAGDPAFLGLAGGRRLARLRPDHRGVLDSVRLSLTDLCGVALLLVAVALLDRGRSWGAAVVLALSRDSRGRHRSSPSESSGRRARRWRPAPSPRPSWCSCRSPSGSAGSSSYSRERAPWGTTISAGPSSASPGTASFA